jgi:hypothetical protein
MCAERSDLISPGGGYSDKRHGDGAKRFIYEVVATATGNRLMRAIIKLDRCEDSCRPSVVENEVNVLLAELPSMWRIPQTVRTLHHIGEAGLDRD